MKIPIEPDDSDDVDPRSLIPPPPTNSIVAPGVLYMTSHSNLMDISNAVTVASGLRIGMPRAEVDKYMREHGIIRTNLYSLRLVRDRTLICPYSLAAPETSLVLEMQCSQSKPRSLDCENPVLSRAYIQSEGANILSINLH